MEVIKKENNAHGEKRIVQDKELPAFWCLIKGDIEKETDKGVNMTEFVNKMKLSSSVKCSWKIKLYQDWNTYIEW